MIWGHKFVSPESSLIYRHNKSLYTMWTAHIEQQKLSPFLYVCRYVSCAGRTYAVSANCIFVCTFFALRSPLMLMRRCVRVCVCRCVGSYLHAECTFSSFPRNHRKNKYHNYRLLICMHKLCIVHFVRIHIFWAITMENERVLSSHPTDIEKIFIID